MDEIKRANIKEKNCCSVVGEDCVSPANLETIRNIKTTCFACGLPACVQCSKIISYYNFGQKRLCNYCIEELERHDNKIAM